MGFEPADIEDSKSALRALQVAMIDSSNDAIVTKGLDGIITGWNAAAQVMYGYSAEEMIGKSVSLLMEPHRADELATIFKHIRSGKPVERYETIRLAKDGHRVTISLTMVPILDSKGHVLGATSLARDITELKLMEETAEGAVRYALGLIEAAPDAVVIVGPDGRIAFANTETERQFGYTKKEIIGNQVEMLMPERFHSQHGDHRRRYASKPEVRPMGIGLALFGRRKDSSEFPVDVTLSPVQIEPGMPGVFAAVRDVTIQRQHAEAEVAHRLAKEMERLTELERFQRLTVGRELKMIELKREIEDLKMKIENLGGATTDSES
jgi:PAS domain S-box-containing protein